MEDSKSFNLRKRSSLLINKNNKKHMRYADIKSHQKINKVIRSRVRCTVRYSLSNNSIDCMILPFPTQIKSTKTWWDCTPYKIHVY